MNSPLRLSAYSARSMDRAQRTHRKLVHTTGSVSTSSLCLRLSARTCQYTRTPLNGLWYNKTMGYMYRAIGWCCGALANNNHFILTTIFRVQKNKEATYFLYLLTCLSNLTILKRWTPWMIDAWWNLRWTPRCFSSSFLVRASRRRPSTRLLAKLSE